MEKIFLRFKDTITKRYAKFSGRASLAEYWSFYLVGVIISVVLYILALITGVGWFFRIIMSAVSLYLIVPNLAVSVRRCHDTGKGGGWIFINLVPFIGWIWFIILMVKRGEPGANRFGEPC